MWTKKTSTVHTHTHYQTHFKIMKVSPEKIPSQKKETALRPSFCLNMCKPRVAKGCSHIPRVSWKAVSRGNVETKSHVQRILLAPAIKIQLLVARRPMTNPFQTNSKGLQQSFALLAASRLVECDKQWSRWHQERVLDSTFLIDED